MLQAVIGNNTPDTLGPPNGQSAIRYTQANDVVKMIKSTNVRTGQGQAMNETLLAECEDNPPRQRERKHGLVGLHFSTDHGWQRSVSNAEC